MKNFEKVPVLFETAENCCGCSACYAVCPKQAISMNPDEEGFLYPVINEELCIRCGQCVKVCVFKRDQAEKNMLD